MLTLNLQNLELLLFLHSFHNTEKKLQILVVR